jgi:hypothetical protein
LIGTPVLNTLLQTKARMALPVLSHAQLALAGHSTQTFFCVRENNMKKTTKLRLIGGGVLLFNLWLIGRYNFEGIPALLITFVFAGGYEYLVVRPVSKSEKIN